VRQVGYLQGSYQDARSTKHKISCNGREINVLKITHLYGLMISCKTSSSTVTIIYKNVIRVIMSLIYMQK